MAEYKHSVSLDIEKCKGCTNCLKPCPTEAIRIRNGHAYIKSMRCVDCGKCISVCPYGAKKAVYDKLSAMDSFKLKIALPAPSLYGQFDNLDDVDYVLQGLLDIGFDDVFEVSRAAELVSDYTRLYMKQPGIKLPVISSACPAVVRLISLRFPFLCENVLPILPPVEIAARLAKTRAKKKHPELKDEDICCCFISPCPAKVSYVSNDMFNGEKSAIDIVVSMSDVYFALIDVMKNDKAPGVSTQSGMIGVSWAATGGEASAVFNDKYLAADGIENVNRVLEQIDNSDFPDLEFVELNACNGGCVGGAMTVANPYIAKARLQSLKRYMPVSQSWKFGSRDSIPDDAKMAEPLQGIPYSPLSGDRNEAIRMMAEIQQIHEKLPDWDCGSCGSPTCMCFAEDIVRGDADREDCVVLVREKLHRLIGEQLKNEKQKDNKDEG